MSGHLGLAMMNGAMSRALLGKTSLVSPQGYQATTPLYFDNEGAVQQANGNPSPGLNTVVKFNIDKTSTLVHNVVLEITLSAGVTNPAFNPDLAIGVGNLPRAEYVRNVGDLIGRQHQLIYGSSQLQTVEGRFHALFRHLCKNDVDIEGLNAMVLGNTPPGGASEQVLIDAFYRGVTLFCPLEELFFNSSLDQSWMPEAYALEGQIQTQLASLGQIVNTSTRDGSEITVAPAITNIRMRFTSITTSAAEKDNRLKLYRTPEGLVQRGWTVEHQQNLLIQGTGARAVFNPAVRATFLDRQPLLRSGRLLLGNLRADIGEMLIVCHRIRATGTPADYPQENAVIDTDFSGSYMEDDFITPSLLVPDANARAGFSTMIEIVGAQVFTGQKPLFDQDIDGFWNRAYIRKFYHPNSHVRGAILSISFARYPEDRRNATGHISAAVAGQLGIELIVHNPGAGPLGTTPIQYHAAVHAHCYNFWQSRGGGIAAAYQ